MGLGRLSPDPHYVGGLSGGLLAANLWTKALTYVRIGPLMRGKPVWHHSHGLILIGAG